MADAALDSIFKAYDVRGIYPHEIDESVARRVGNALVSFTGAARVLVGRDARPSSEPLVAALIEGATIAGADVVELGIVSTDLCYFASGHFDAPAAMVTASHNPPQYNGLKLCRAGAAPIGEGTGLNEIKAMVAGGLLERGEDPGRVEQRDLLPAFAEHVRSFVNVDALVPMRVVADTANGVGGLIVPAVFDGLPFDLTMLYAELDGTFPNHSPDVMNVDNLADLRDAVREGGGVGLAFDGDADRVVLVDDAAEVVSGSTTTAILAAALLDGHPGESVVYNVICSKAVPEVIREHGGKPVKSRVGHSFMKQVMADTGAIFGGEHSAHYYFRENFRADSGIIAALMVLEQLSKSGLPLSELRKPYERYAQSGEINTRVDGSVDDVIERVAARYEDGMQERLDGLTVDMGDWWFNLRPSNTEPLLRLNLEAADRESCDAHTAEVLAIVRATA